MSLTANKNLSAQAAASGAGIWGAGASTALNEGVITPVDLMLGGLLTKTLASSNVTLNATESQYGGVLLNGTLSANVTITSSNIGFYIVENFTTGSFSVAWTNGVNTLYLPQNTHFWIQADAVNGVRIVSQSLSLIAPPQGYLTLVAGTPVITSDQTAKNTVYYTPVTGNQFPVYDGTVMQAVNFAELTLTLNSNHLASTIYDVWGFANAGMATIATGPAWQNSGSGTGTRGTGAGTSEYTRVRGVIVNANAMTVRNGATTYSVAANQGTYLGSLFIDSSAGQVSCYVSWGQNRKWGVWNAYNRFPLCLQGGDSTATWTYAGPAIRPANNDSNNKITVFCGLPEERVMARFQQRIGANLGGPSAVTGVGWNSITSILGLNGVVNNTQDAGGSATVPSEYDAQAFIGIINVTALENADPGTALFYGTQAYMLLTANWRG